MHQARPARHSVRNALFLDIPYIVDSTCRHGDYRLNRLHSYVRGSKPVLRPYAMLPPFVWFVLVLLFAAYGATFSALCGVFGATTVSALRVGAGWCCIVAALAQFLGSAVFIHGRIAKRFRKQQIKDPWRKGVVQLVFAVVLAVWALPLYFFGHSLLDTAAFDVCRADTQHWPAGVQLAVFLVAAGVGGVITFKDLPVRTRILWQAALLTVLVSVIWYMPGITVRSEAAQVPYPHLYAAIALCFAAIAVLATWLIRIPFSSMLDRERKPFRRALRRRELFPDSRRDPTLSPRRIFGGGVIGVLDKPAQFLLLPAFAIILVPSGFIWHACVTGVLISVLLVIASNLTRRWDQMSQYLRRYFLQGTPLVASAAVIVIALLRLSNVQYVATVLNVAPFGVVFMWIIMAYVLAWWFEYQVNSVLAAELLRIFGTDGRRDGGVIDYAPGAQFEAASTRVECTERYLAAHATGQFVVLGWFTERETGERVTAFHTYAFVELFTALLGRQNPEATHEVGRRVQLYFALVNGLLALSLGLLLWHLGRDERANTVMPVVQASYGPTARNVDLAALLHAESRQTPAAIVVAASGGGTRAALYTASVLEGLHALKADKNIVMLSGVSGGGVAAAYFYSHRAELLDNKEIKCDALDQELKNPWTCFLDRMTMPFIRDVLQGSGEWRIQSEQPLGMLLAESFERRLFADGRQHMGDDASVGLILNTTVTGHPLDEAPMLNGATVRAPNVSNEPCEAFQRPVSALAGGRLAFSNLRNVSAFQRQDGAIPNVHMPFLVVQDDHVEIARAAALNANFPPVFSNARVDLTGATGGCGIRSYYVTDGGATENLGLLSALLALHSALQGPNIKAPLRDIEIVLAEASAIGYDYTQDRGVGAATGQAKERLTGRLTLELLDRVTQAMHAVDPSASVRIHDLSLPRVFRSRGGFGTHWMFPETIRVTNPLTTPLPPSWMQTVAQYSGLDRYWVTLSRTQLMTMWQALHDPEREFCDRQWPADPFADLSSLSNWICGRTAAGDRVTGADHLPKAWRALRESLKGESPP